MKRNKSHIFLFLLVILGCILLFNFKNKANSFLSPEERIPAVSTIWSRSREFYGYWDHLSYVDWDVEYENAFSLALRAKDRKEYYAVLSSFVAKLQDGHSKIYCAAIEERPASEKKSSAICPIQLCFMEGKYVVCAVQSEIKEAIPLGSEVIKMNEMPTNLYLEAEFGDTVSVQTPNARQALLAQKLTNTNDSVNSIVISGVTPLGNNFNERIYDQGKDIDLEKMDMNNTTDCVYESFSGSEIDEKSYIAKIPSFQMKHLVVI